MPNYGGETPLIHQDGRITVEAPTGTTAAAPVVAGRIYRLSPTTLTSDGVTTYKLAAAVAADTTQSVILVQALEGTNSETRPIGCVWLSGYSGQVRRLPYTTGLAPTLGQSITVGANNYNVAGKVWAAGQGTVLAIDTASLTCEVLL